MVRTVSIKEVRESCFRFWMAIDVGSRQARDHVEQRCLPPHRRPFGLAGSCSVHQCHL